MAERDEVKLLGYWASPYSRRVEMALKLKGIPYEYSEEDLSNKSPLLLQLNPVHKKIPVFVHNGKPVSESLVILEYIDETWKQNPILPQDPHDRAMARFWANLVDDKILSAGLYSLIKAENRREVVIEEIQELLNHLEKELTGKDYFCGSNVGFLDIVASSMIVFCLTRLWEGLQLEVIPEDKFPEIHRWTRNLNKVEAVMECVPPREKHIEHMMSFVEKDQLSS